MLRLPEFIAFDLETTGLSQENDHLLEIGAVHIRNGEIIARFSQLAKPPIALSLLVQHLTGISDADVVDAGSATEALTGFAAFAGQLPLVAHNSEFDAGFLGAQRVKAGMDPITNLVFDSLLAARMAWPEAPNHRLETLVNFLALANAKAHRALPDAEKSGALWLKAEAVLSNLPEPYASYIDQLLSLAPAPWNSFAKGLTHSEIMPNWGEAASPTKLALPNLGDDFSEKGGWASVAINSGLEMGAWPKHAGQDLFRSLNEGRWLALEADNASSSWLGLSAALAASNKGTGRILVVVPDRRAEEYLLQTVLPAYLDEAEANLIKGKINSVDTNSDITLGAENSVKTKVVLPSSIAVLREPEAYLSTSRLMSLLARPTQRLTPQEILQVMPLLCWAAKTGQGDLSMYPGISADRGRPIWMKVAADGFAAHEVFATRARQKAEAARIIVTRLETFVRDLSLDGALLPACDGVLIFDAHRLPEVAEMEWGRELHFFRIRHGLQLVSAARETGEGLSAWAKVLLHEGALPESSREVVEGLAEQTQEAEKAVQKWLARIGRQAEKTVKSGENRARYHDRIAQAFSSPEVDALAALDKLHDQLNQLGRLPGLGDVDFGLECQRVAARLQQMHVLIAHVCEPKENEVAWAEDFLNPHRIRIRTRLLEVGPILTEKLVAVHRGGAFVSAALATGDDTSRYFSKRAGLNALPSRLRYAVETQAPDLRECLIMPFAPVMNNSEAAKSMGALLAKSLGELVMPTVVVFPGTSHIRAVRDELVKGLPEGRTVIAQGIDGNRDNLTFLFHSVTAPILLVAEINQGWVDAKGDVPRIVVVTRLPFAAPSDPLVAARSDVLHAQAKHALFELLVPDATQKLKEALASLAQPAVRQSIWMMDPRISREKYGQFVVKTLAKHHQHLSQPGEIQTATSAWLVS